MKTDRELLELAAKAAGIDIGFISGLPHTGIGSYMPEYWNPLIDDGDALRLAVKLGMCLDLQGTRSIATVRQDGWQQPHDGEPDAATRRAIVRAAAAIGESMP